MAQRWGLALPLQADPCASAGAQGLQCHRSVSGSLSLIRLIDRPVLLTLQRPGQAPALAALVGLDAQRATLLVDGTPRPVALAELAGAWRGEFTTLWRPPPGYANRADQNPKADAVVALGGNPARLDPNAGVPGSDAALVNRATRYGRDPNVRAELATADAEFRKRKNIFNWSLVPDNRYNRAYSGQSLDPNEWLRRYRAAGARTPTAPPAN